jgi:hypothetical protein
MSSPAGGDASRYPPRQRFLTADSCASALWQGELPFLRLRFRVVLGQDLERLAVLVDDTAADARICSRTLSVGRRRSSPPGISSRSTDEPGGGLAAAYRQNGQQNVQEMSKRRKNARGTRPACGARTACKAARRARSRHPCPSLSNRWRALRRQRSQVRILPGAPRIHAGLRPIWGNDVPPPCPRS